MPVRTVSDPLGRFVILLVTSPYSFSEWKTAVREALATPLFCQTRAILVDRRNSTPATVQFVDDMLNFFADHAGQFAGSRAAIVTSDDVAFGMGRMTELRAQERNPTLTVHPSHDYDEAVDWLEQMAGTAVTETRSRDDRPTLAEAALQGGDVQCHHGGEWIWKKMAVLVGPDLYACGPSRRDCPEVPREQRG